MPTGIRGLPPVRPGNATGKLFADNERARQRKRQHAEAARRAAEEAKYDQTPGQIVAEVQAHHPSGEAYFDPEVGDVVVDYTSGR